MIRKTVAHFFDFLYTMRYKIKEVCYMFSKKNDDNNMKQYKKRGCCTNTG